MRILCRRWAARHLRLRRELEIVVIDGERRFGNRRLLPGRSAARTSRSPRQRRCGGVVNGGTDGVGGLKMALTGAEAVALIGGSALVRARARPGSRPRRDRQPRTFLFAMLRQGLIIPHPVQGHTHSRRDLEFGDSLPVLLTGMR